jgi:adenylate cyclase
LPVQTKKLAILFADISGSTALYEKMGDHLARQLIGRAIAILKGALNTHRGTLVKTIGDEILCTFPSAELAMNAACEMQLAIQTDNQSSSQPLYVRIGFHFGEVICEDDDIYGDAVNVAARVASITRASQIMTTATVAELLPLAMQDKIQKILRAAIKGKLEHIDIFQVIWEQEDMGRTRIGMTAFRKPTLQTIELMLHYMGHTYSINESNPKLLIGRDETCNIVIKNDFASRQHADIEFRLGKFIFSDRSSNGSYIKEANEIIRLNRDNAALHNKGSISLGQPYSDNPADLIEYVIVAMS